MSASSFLKKNSGNIPATGLGGSSLIIVLIMTLGPGASFSDDTNIITPNLDKIDTELHQHMAAEAHPITMQKLIDIYDEIDDLEKEVGDIEKQMKITNDILIEIKTIVQTNK